MSKKCVAIVNTSINIILITQLRRKLLPSVEFDLILGGKRTKEAYDSGELDKYFNNVYYYDQDDYGVTLSKYLSPRNTLKEMLGEEPKEYTDIFFWNPDWLFYNYYRFLRKNNPKLHLYGDGIGLYMIKPINFPMYQGRAGKLFNAVDKNLFNWYDIDALDFDIYAFRPELICYEDSHKKYTVPQLSSDDVKEFSKMFAYKDSPESAKYIFLDCPRYFGWVDDSDVAEIISCIRDNTGEGEFLVRRHPSIKPEYYDELNVRLMDQSIMWELFYMNEDIEDKTIIGTGSGALIQAYVMTGKLCRTILLSELIPTKLDLLSEPMTKLFDTIAEESGKILTPKTKEELIELL